MANIYGTPGNDVLTGTAGQDVLVGLGGDDWLDDGGGGPDEMIGGTGDDVYVVRTLGDSIVEHAGEGSDTVRTALARFTLPGHVERLFTIGAGAFTGIGNAEANVIVGGAGDDVLDGGEGGDYLVGGGGDDRLIGGAGAANQLQGGAGDDLYYVGAAGDSVIELAGEGTDQVRTTLAAYRLAANVENLVFAGLGGFAGTGNALANIIFGGGGDDSLDGGEGADYLIGGAGADTLDGGAGAANQLQGGTGDDIYLVKASGESVIEFAGEGTDTVRTALGSYRLPGNVENLLYVGGGDFIGRGNSGDNMITGGGGDDFLFAGGGVDIIYGGAGNDVIEARGSGAEYSDPASRFHGGAGNDTYYTSAVASDGTVASVVENANEGTDTLRTSFSSWIRMPANVENFVYIPYYNWNGDFASSAFVEGNDLNNVIIGSLVQYNYINMWGESEPSGFNNLRGNGGNDTIVSGNGPDFLDGGAGVDTAIGGRNDDGYRIDNIGDSVVEYAGEGTDTVHLTTISAYALAANVENLVVETPGAVDVRGNELANILRFEWDANGNVLHAETDDGFDGGAGNDVIHSGGGNDRLRGGGGADTFWHKAGEAGIDRIFDFTPGTDIIALTGYATTGEVRVETGATPSTELSTFLYNSVTGLLSYDADGSRAGAAVTFAQLDPGLSLGRGDFFI